MNSRTQFGDRKRLWDNIVDERFDIVGALSLIGVAGHQQDGEFGTFARRAERERDTVHHRHAHVGEK